MRQLMNHRNGGRLHPLRTAHRDDGSNRYEDRIESLAIAHGDIARGGRGGPCGEASLHEGTRRVGHIGTEPVAWLKRSSSFVPDHFERDRVGSSIVPAAHVERRERIKRNKGASGRDRGLLRSLH